MIKQIGVSEPLFDCFAPEGEGFDFEVDLDLDGSIGRGADPAATCEITAEACDAECDGLERNGWGLGFPRQHVEQCVLSDEALMRSILGGDAAALSLLYDRYAAILKSVALAVVHDAAEADDLLQEAFLQIWKQAKRYSSDKGRPFAWIVTLTRRRAIDRLRRRRTYSSVKERFEMAIESQSWVYSRIEADIHLADIRAFLQTKLALLPPYQRQAIEMAFFEGKSQREIAVATGTSLGTIKTRLELGLKKLSGSVRGIRHMI